MIRVEPPAACRPVVNDASGVGLLRARRIYVQQLSGSILVLVILNNIVANTTTLANMVCQVAKDVCYETAI
jgi:hypothetical protein